MICHKLLSFGKNYSIINGIYKWGFCVFGGLRVAYVGGNLNNGTNDGLVYWNCNNDVGNAWFNIGARISHNILIIMYTIYLPLSGLALPLGKNCRCRRG